MSLFSAPTIYEDPDAKERKPRVWPAPLALPVQGAILCVRSMVRKWWIDPQTELPMVGVKQPSDYPPLSEYTDPLVKTFGPDFFMDAVPSPPNAIFAVADSIKDRPQGLTMAIIEATDNAGRLIARDCLTVFDEIHQELSEQNLSHQNVLPILMVTPDSHRDEGRTPQGHIHLRESAHYRNLVIVETTIPTTRQDFVDFLALLHHPHQYPPSLPSA